MGVMATFVYVIPWSQGVFSINTASDIWGILKFMPNTPEKPCTVVRCL